MKLHLWGILFAFAPVSCITVNIYFPAPEVRQAAEEIVEETWGAESPRPQATKESSWLRLFEPSRAEAQEADINVSTAAIRALKDSMRKRAAQLKPFLSAGRVGIGKDGMLAIRGLDGVPLSEQATIRRLVEAENRDRASLYREIAEANDFGSERVPDIQRIFAETWSAKAEKGWLVQKSDGTWVQH
jgi:uncharacterized protein YdbL (DUF1318 family)